MRIRKHQAEGPQDGRSMVEMLGVLAIIGVLSVGAIAGYSSAMNKHKLNKQAQQLNWLLNILHQYKSQWIFDEQFVHIVPYYKKLGLIPEEMIKDDSNYIYDAFGFKISMGTNSCYNDKCNSVIVMYNTVNNRFSFDICQNFFITAVAFHEQLELFSTFSSTATEQSKNTYYGDKYCGKNLICLKDMDLEKIYKTCQTLNSGQNFRPFFSFRIKD